MTKEAAEWVSEAKLSEGLLPGENIKKTIRGLRKEHLFEGDDFRISHKEVQYSKTGVWKIMELMNLKNAPQSPVAGQAAGTDQGKAPAEKTAHASQEVPSAIVVRVWQNNPHYLLARIGKQEITVHARETRNFIPGMPVTLDKLSRRGQFSQIYDFTGRCPRARGKW